MALSNITNKTLPHQSHPPPTTQSMTTSQDPSLSPVADTKTNRITEATTAALTLSPSPKMRPLNFLVPLYPGFQLMDLTGPLDILNILTLPPFSQPLRLIFLGSTPSPVPTKPVVPASANYTYDLHSVLGVGEVNTTFQQWWNVDDTFSGYLEKLNGGGIPDEERPDVLLIPGGLGSRMNRITPSPTPEDPTNSTTTLNIADLIEWIPNVVPYVKTGIITVCTGSDILARTGILENRRATTNMLRFKEVSQRHTGVKWEKGARWVRSVAGDGRPSISAATAASADNDKNTTTTPAQDLEIWSSAGISAGMDVTLAFIAEYYGGMEISRDIARRLEYDWGETKEGEIHGMYQRFFGV